VDDEAAMASLALASTDRFFLGAAGTSSHVSVFIEQLISSLHIYLIELEQMPLLAARRRAPPQVVIVVSSFLQRVRMFQYLACAGAELNKIFRAIYDNI